MKRPTLFAFVVLFTVVLTLVLTQPVSARESDYDAVVTHLKTQYQATRRHIPLLGLARFAARVVRPAGVRSFDVALFDKLNLAGPEQAVALAQSIGSVLGTDWQPVMRTRSATGDLMLVYARERNDKINLIVVVLDDETAAVVRAKVDPEKIFAFMANPKLLGIALH